MSRMDLNLMAVFAALIEEGSASKAAFRLGLTQSGVSHALAKLRGHTDDPLFVRSASGLSPTPRAEQMAATICPAVAQLQGLFDRSAFDPANSTRQFKISAGVYASEHILPLVFQLAQTQAASVRFVISTMRAGTARALDNSDIDLAIGAFDIVTERFVATHLFDEKLIWVVRAGHPALARGPLPLERIAELPRVSLQAGEPIVAPDWGLRTQDDGPVLIEDLLETPLVSFLHAAPPAFAIYDPRSALATVVQTDCVALVPRRVLQANRGLYDVVPLGCANTETAMPVSMIWHRRQDKDPAHIWLRGMLREVAHKL